MVAHILLSVWVRMYGNNSEINMCTEVFSFIFPPFLRKGTYSEDGADTSSESCEILH